jgi:hypothetical protein
MAIRISIFGFLRIPKSIIFQLSSTPGPPYIGHFNILKLYFLVKNLIIESNEPSENGLGIEIGQFDSEIKVGKS